MPESRRQHTMAHNRSFAMNIWFGTRNGLERRPNRALTAAIHCLFKCPAPAVLGRA